MAIALIALAATAATQTAQAQEYYVWITNTNGMTEKVIMPGTSHILTQSNNLDIVEIVVPEHTRISQIYVLNCANLTNLVIEPITGKRHQRFNNQGAWWNDTDLIIHADGSGLRNITCRKTMRETLTLHRTGWHAIQWTELPKMEIRRISNGKEVEVIWRTGNLQLADAVSGEWKDYNGSSLFRFPLATAKDMQFFRIKPEEEEEPEEESQ